MILATMRLRPGQFEYFINRPIFHMHLRCNFIDLPYALLECWEDEQMQRLRHIQGFPAFFSIRPLCKGKMKLLIGPAPYKSCRLVLWGEKMRIA